ncbi:hypothetical protein HAX54_037430, partial [Datura stramonium]|nr:hypothetical protein [Datura stramonium]
ARDPPVFVTRGARRQHFNAKACATQHSIGAMLGARRNSSSAMAYMAHQHRANVVPHRACCSAKMLAPCASGHAIVLASRYAGRAGVKVQCYML